MTREQLIEAGKVWHVCEDDEVVFEGTKTAGERYMRQHNLWRRYRRGGQGVSFGKVIGEYDWTADELRAESERIAEIAAQRRRNGEIGAVTFQKLADDYAEAAEQFQLHNSPPAPKPLVFENNDCRQRVLFSGMCALPGQLDLIPDLDGGG